MNSAIFTHAAQITKSDSANLTKQTLVQVATPTAVVADSVTIASDIITKASNGLANGDVIQFTSLGTVTGISLATDYYIVGVSGNDFSVAVSLGGSVINLTGANTTPPTYQKTYDITTSPVTGAIYVGGAGNVIALPATHPDTNVTTVQNLGAQKFVCVAGQIIPGNFKKVFSTGTTATEMVLLFDDAS